MAEFVNVHIGSQLQVATAEPGNEGSAELADRDALILGKVMMLFQELYLRVVRFLLVVLFHILVLLNLKQH